MKFGICTSIDSAAIVKDAGWDYIELPARELLEREVERSPLPARAVNLLIPAAMKITGPAVDLAAVFAYLQQIIDRASAIGVQVLVFGSSGARNVPDDFDRAKAAGQIIDFCRGAADLAAKKNLLIAIEPLDRGECNIINSLIEAAEYVNGLARPALVAVLDTYHFWVANDPLDVVVVASGKQFIRHVHVADKAGRVPPGESGNCDYRPLFRILKQGGYDSTISVEADFPDDLIRKRGQKILEYLKQEWQES